MANAVITSDANRIYIVFNDMTSLAGMPSGDWSKDAISIAMNLSNIDIFFSAINEQQWRIGFNSKIIIDSVDGVAPTDNSDLFTKIQAALIVTGGGGYDGDPTTINQDATHRFATDAEKSTWNAKVDTGDSRLTDARTPLAHTHPQSEVTNLVSDLASKQATLVSATNIKTVNGSSILGSGNLVVASGYHFVGTLAGDQATGANVTPVTLTGLVFSYTANSTYRIWFMGRVQPTAATTGCGFQFDLSTAVTAISVKFDHQLANTGTISGGHSIADDASVGVSSGMPGTSTYPISGEGLLVTGANAGTAQLRFRSETTAVTTCKAGFTMVIEKIV